MGQVQDLVICVGLVGSAEPSNAYSGWLCSASQGARFVVVVVVCFAFVFFGLFVCLFFQNPRATLGVGLTQL